MIVEINDKGDDKRVEVEKVGPAGGVTNGQTAVEGPTIPEAPPALLFGPFFMFKTILKTSRVPCFGKSDNLCRCRV